MIGFRIEVQESAVLPAGDVALATEALGQSRSFPDPAFSQLLTPTVVLRQLEGAWKLAVAMPWGKR